MNKRKLFSWAKQIVNNNDHSFLPKKATFLVFSDMSSSIHLSSVTFVHPNQATEIFRDVSRPFGTLATRWHPGKILRRLSQENPSVRAVKQKRGSRI